MINYPLNDNVFSYREGVSTETALHKAVVKIEQALDNKHYAIAIFLDISGAFSNTSTDSMIKSLANKGVEKDIICWITNLLKNRIAKASLGNTTINKDITTGASDGGISTHRFPPESATNCNAFADDMFLIRTGKDIWEVALHMQIGVNSLCDWAQEHNLKFNADKTKAMIFTRKYKFEKPEIWINQKPIE